MQGSGTCFWEFSKFLKPGAHYLFPFPLLILSALKVFFCEPSAEISAMRQPNLLPVGLDKIQSVHEQVGNARCYLGIC